MDMEYSNEYVDLSFLGDFVGRVIQIERGGPDKTEGLLLDVQEDFLTMRTKQGTIFVNSNHIKSVSVPVVSGRGRDQHFETDDDDDAIGAQNFGDLLSQLRNRMVKINQGGPNALQGVLMESRGESVTLLHNMKEFVHFPVFHIKSVTLIEDKKDDKKDDKKEKGQGRGSHGKRRSSGNRRNKNKSKKRRNRRKKGKR